MPASGHASAVEAVDGMTSEFLDATSHHRGLVGQEAKMEERFSDDPSLLRGTFMPWFARIIWLPNSALEGGTRGIVPVPAACASNVQKPRDFRRVRHYRMCSIFSVW